MPRSPRSFYPSDKKFRALQGFYHTRLTLPQFCQSQNIPISRFLAWRSDILNNDSGSISNKEKQLIFRLMLESEHSKINSLNRAISKQRRLNKQLLKSRDATKNYYSAIWDDIARFNGVSQQEGITNRFRKRYSTREKMLIIKLVENSTLSQIHALQILGIIRHTYGNWLTAFKKGGEAALEAKVRKHRNINTLPKAVAEIILCLRHQYPYIGYEPAAAMITRITGHFVGASTVRRVILDSGWIAKKYKSQDSRKEYTEGHSAYPNRHWLLGTMQLIVPESSIMNLFTVMDENSSYVIDWISTSTKSTRDVMHVLTRAIFSAKREFASQLMLDVPRGPSFHSKDLSVFCKRMEIDKLPPNSKKSVSRSRISSFHTELRKAVNMIRPSSYQELMQFLIEYINYYNNLRPRSALKDSSPYYIYHEIGMVSAVSLDEIKSNSRDFWKFYKKSFK